MRTLVVVNPASASGRTGQQWPSLEPVFRKHLGEFESTLTERPGHAAELVRRALLSGCERIVSVGGDGSNFDAIQGFFAPVTHAAIAPHACFAFVSSGTGSDLGRTLGLPMSVEDQLARIAGATPRQIDAISCSFIGESGPDWRIALNAVGLGQCGDLVRRVDRWKWLGNSSFPFVAAGIAGVLQNTPWTFEIRIDDGEWQTRKLRNLALFNGRFQGGGMQWAPDARIDDGTLDLVAMGEVGAIRAIRTGIASYSRRIDHDYGMWTAQVRKVEVVVQPGQPPAWVEFDGESPGQIPATYEVMPGAIRLAM
jgi:diacylglycerol kinase family enzyme